METKGTLFYGKQTPRKDILEMLAMLPVLLLIGCSTQRESLENILSPVCEGQGLSETAPYEGGPGPHPIVLLNASGELHRWNDEMPAGWKPDSAGSTELVACLGDEQKTLVNTIPCHLPEIGLPLPPVKTYEHELEVRVMAAQTGALVARQTLYTFPLNGCDQSNCHLPAGRACGVSHVTPAQVEHWLVSTVEKGEPLRNLRGHSSTVNSVAWSPDGKVLASASSDGRIIVWDVRAGQPIHTLQAHTEGVISVAWSPDGKTIASGARDNRIILWDAGTGQVLRTMQGPGDHAASVDWSPDGSVLASKWGEDILLWDTKTGQLLKTLEGQGDQVFSVAWSPDGKRLAAGSGDGSITLWDTERAQPSGRLSGHTEPVSGLAWSPDGKTVASGSWDTSIILWDVQSGQPLFRQKEHNSTVSSVAFSPDGKRLASGYSDSVIILWDTETGKQVYMLRENIVPVLSVAWSPVSAATGTMLASALRDGSVILWWTAPEG